MSGIHTTLVEDAHGYTRSSVPWQMDENRAAAGVTTRGRKFGWRLFHYLSGGGMRAFGRSVRQEEADARRNRFLAASAAVAALWLALLLA